VFLNFILGFLQLLNNIIQNFKKNSDFVIKKSSNH
jgi:hypothetical protein